jgi:hypothetical protein
MCSFPCARGPLLCCLCLVMTAVTRLKARKIGRDVRHCCSLAVVFRTGRKGGPTLFLPTYASVMQWGDFLINLKDLDSCSLGLSGVMCTAFNLVMEASNADSLNQCIYEYCWVQSCAELRPHFPKHLNGVMQLLLLLVHGGEKNCVPNYRQVSYSLDERSCCRPLAKSDTT